MPTVTTAVRVSTPYCAPMFFAAAAIVFTASIAAADPPGGPPHESLVEGGRGGPPHEAAPAPAIIKRPLRVAVYDFEIVGFDQHQGRVVIASVLAELRKLERTNVIGMSEIKQMLDHEAQKQLLGCSQESCLTEVADALGVDVLVVGAIGKAGEQTTFEMKRIDQRQAKVTGHVERRFAAGNGEEVLVSVGPAVAQLFPDVPLREGAVRGVAQEMALRLNPPPLPTWVFGGEVGLAGASFTTAAVLGVVWTGVAAQANTLKGEGKFDKFTRTADDADHLLYAAYTAVGAGGAFTVAAGISALFTDFWGYAEMNEEAAAVAAK
jgi:hypothetical protein